MVAGAWEGGNGSQFLAPAVSPWLVAMESSLLGSLGSPPPQGVHVLPTSPRTGLIIVNKSFYLK